MTLADEIAAAEAHLADLKRRDAAASCAEVGHRWVFIGGRNAGCCDDCTCSVPVHACSGCHDCDYGVPAQAGVIAECKEREGWE